MRVPNLTKFWSELKSVARDVLWPTPKDLLKNGLLVVGSSLVMMAILLSADYVFYSLRALILK